jgi:hypothetical protein
MVVTGAYEEEETRSYCLMSAENWFCKKKKVLEMDIGAGCPRM